MDFDRIKYLEDIVKVMLRRRAEEDAVLSTNSNNAQSEFAAVTEEAAARRETETGREQGVQELQDRANGPPRHVMGGTGKRNQDRERKKNPTPPTKGEISNGTCAMFRNT